MANPRLRRLSRIAIALAVIVAALALLWAVWWLWSLLSPPWDSRTVIAIAIAALALLAGIWWLWWRLPRRQVARLALKIRDPKARADTEDNFRKTVGQALGGAAVLIGAGAAYLQFSQQQRASHDLLISNQVAKGFEQLGQQGSDKMVLRLGGIYALEGVMNGSEQYHQPVLEALCAFVRDGTKKHHGEDPPATDIQAALTVIARRGPGMGEVTLSGADLSGANLNNANLAGADLNNANLAGADLSGVNLRKANLASAVLSSAGLNNANLSDANLSYANLSRAVLVGANLSKAFLRGVNLGQADLSQSNLSGATLNDVDLSGADVGQLQLDQACGWGKLDSNLVLKPCS